MARAQKKTDPIYSFDVYAVAPSTTRKVTTVKATDIEDARKRGKRALERFSFDPDTVFVCRTPAKEG